MDYVDPWGGFNQGVNTLREAADSQVMRQARQIQNEDAQLDLNLKKELYPQTKQLMQEDITSKLGVNTLQQIDAIAQAADFVRGNPEMAKQIGSKMGVDPGMLASIKRPRPDMYTLDTEDGNTVVVVRDGKGGVKVMKTTDPQLEQKHQYRMEENQARYQAQLANTLAGIAARTDRTMNRRYIQKGVTETGEPISFDTATNTYFVNGAPVSIDPKTGKLAMSKMIPQPEDDTGVETESPTGSPFVLYPNKDAAALAGAVGSGAKGAITQNRADTESYKRQLGTYDAMVPIISTLHQQHDRINQIMQGLEGQDQRILQKPVKQLRQYIKGEAALNAYDMYLNEISNENARLTSGGALSTAQTNVASSEKWHKIHDPDLPFAQASNLLKETVHSADMRVGEQYKNVENIYSRISGGKKSDVKAPKDIVPGFLNTVSKPTTSTGQTKTFSGLKPAIQQKIQATPEWQKLKKGQSIQIQSGATGETITITKDTD